MLLGVTRQPDPLLARVLVPSGLSLIGLYHEVAAGCSAGEKLATSVEIPFSAACLRVFDAAGEEAQRLGREHIGTEHLILGLLREQGSVPATILSRNGLGADDVRNALVKLLAEDSARSTT